MIPEATPEQIQLFKQGAAERYRELGITPGDADVLFNTHMAKVAKELGVAPLSPAAEKFAAALRGSLRR